jgi:predicted DNA-binding protein with PD1-like motif
VQLVDDSAIARGMIRVEPGEDLVAALEALALAAGWREAFVTGTGMLDMVELGRGVETMTFEQAQLTSLSGRVVRRGERCEASLHAVVVTGGQLQAGRVVAAVTGELLLVVDAVALAGSTARGVMPRTAPPVERTPIPREAVESSDARSAHKPPSQNFTAKPVIIPRAPEVVAEEDIEHWTEVELGCFLEHPQLGFCEVVGDDESGGTRVRIANGRVLVLRLDTLHVLAPETDAEGRRVFKISGPRKRR